ncbi:MAG: YbfB/YjiJ family MFS transporter [Desulfobulbaceae bacterium]|uniref:YbfB/YjiJ family MFS transporter n=1 Tax=Candidatus Desulfatifera sulfidica TaxID=2841691 RepID=A0A8J6N6Y6_9BACT|nr:YbfB/YjiJ family MFS transporter [Candidatus Desulfatifera sulfidica]
MACLGIGRFSLGMLLPSMGEALALSYGQMGLISTLNFAGYLAAILFCGRLNTRFGSRRLITVALLVIGLSMLAISQVESLAAIIVFYVITGMGSALANVPIMAMITAWFTKARRGRAAGLVAVGSGFAIILSGQLVPWLNLNHDEGWRLSWQVLGSVVLLIGLICFLILRDTPQELGLEPVGGSCELPADQEKERPRLSLRSPLVLHCGAIYFLFGFTYVIYATFIVTTLVQERGIAESTAGQFWSWVGFLSLFSGPVFGSLSDRMGRRAGLVLVFAIQTIAYLLAGLDLPQIFLYLSIFCFGIVAWSVPTIMAALVGDYAPPAQVATIFGFVTFVFGLGQISGPFLAGQLAEHSNSFSGSFLMAAVMTTLAVLLARRLPSESSSP